MEPPPTVAEAPPPPGGGSPWFRRLTLFSLLASLCPLIPLPFLDDWTLEWVRKRLALESCRAHGREPSPAELQILTWRPEEGWLRGCLRFTLVAPLVKLVVYLVRKVFRKVVFVLTLSDCADRFSETFHEGYLLERSFQLGLVEGGAPAAERLMAVRRAILHACATVDPRPVRQIARRAFQGSRQALKEAARLLGAAARRKRTRGGEGAPAAAVDDPLGIAEEERLLAGLLDRLTAALWHQEGYRAHLESVFLAAAPPAGAP